ncbi:hypothetical protein THAOC_37442 [Thalassiosira oceanica]|uniref:Uncharacterized protein n=1 Tax=Thalassiosira oceanica TaxID=159749 RepID=K0QYD5_THAOC|nr:hypothetical protein THAOC_37442 [Thalassiosira oceanica]|eukprot:EJK44053.1 hypothetical protein THAOC_37442 [Thalassiosira oceanica]
MKANKALIKFGELRINSVLRSKNPTPSHLSQPTQQPATLRKLHKRLIQAALHFPQGFFPADAFILHRKPPPTDPSSLLECLLLMS